MFYFRLDQRETDKIDKHTIKIYIKTVMQKQINIQRDTEQKVCNLAHYKSFNREKTT